MGVCRGEVSSLCKQLIDVCTQQLMYCLLWLLEHMNLLKLLEGGQVGKF